MNSLRHLQLRLPTLIVTLGTSTMFKGVLIAYVGAKYVADLPRGMTRLGNANLLSIPSGRRLATCTCSWWGLTGLCVLVWWLLCYPRHVGTERLL